MSCQLPTRRALLGLGLRLELRLGLILEGLGLRHFSKPCGHALLAPALTANSLISDDLRKGLLDRAEHTFQLALTLAVCSGVAVMVLMEVRGEVCVGLGGGHTQGVRLPSVAR